MDAWIPIIATPAIAEALKTWGSFGLVLVALGVALLLSERRSRAKDAKIEKLETANAALQELRLQEAREMIRVAQSGTATMAARAEGDAGFRDLMTQLVFLMSQVPGVPKLPPGATPQIPPPGRS